MTLHAQLQRDDFSAQPQAAIGVRRGDMLVTIPGRPAAPFVECDGHPYHTAVFREAVRDAALRAQGLEVLHLPARLIMRDPEGAAQRVRAALKLRDESGDPADSEQ